MARNNFAAERFDTGRMTQVEAIDLEPVPPVGEVRLARIAGGRITRKARRYDEVRPASQQLQPGLIPDLHASAGQQRGASGKVGQFRPLGEVERRAGRAKLVVEMVDRGVSLLADIAVLRLDGLALLRIRGFDLPEVLGWQEVRGGKNGLAAKRPNARFVQNGFHALGRGGAAQALSGFEFATAGNGVGVVELGHGQVEAFAVRLGNVVEKTAVRVDGFEEFRGRSHLVEQRGGKCLHFAGTSSLAPARESHPRSRFRRVDASAFAAHALPLLGSHSGAESLALFESHGVPTVDEAGAASPPPSAAPAKAAE